jgi:eukaryotic-like serine/threonine-protein kinase
MTEVASRLSASLADRYRIERELGSGGMATVYLARDLRHDRDVAIKVLRPELAAVIGAERFLSEIKTTANLQHPHILPLFDSGEADGFLFYVMPFVEGESLRDRLTREKQLPIADAVRIATEVAGALDYAHRHKVIHRDIKPENILLHDGRALVADFGIALAASKAGGGRMTETGMSLGTPLYMSPEQAMGEREITARSDVYALGCVTYEMLAGDPPFTGSTAQAIVAKVMTEKPARPSRVRDTIPEDVEEAILIALAKLPADRFATAAEFATALAGGGATVRRAVNSGPRDGLAAKPWSRALIGVAALLLLGVGFIAGRWVLGRHSASRIVFAPKTFHRQGIFNARFAPDGRTIVLSATTDSNGPGLFILRPDYPEQTSLGLTDTHLLSVSSKGELAILVHAEFIRHRLFQGTLARVPLDGGAPRQVLDSVREADWSPDGTELAVIHDVHGEDRLEYPIGKVLYEAAGYLSDPKVSPDGKRVAFVEHPFRWDDRGSIKVVDRLGKTSITTRNFPSIEGLAWETRSDQVLFSASGATGMIVFGVSESGQVREVMSGPGDLTMQDVSRSGQVLVTRDDASYRLMLRGRNSEIERDVSWLNTPFGPVLAHDGSLLAFSDGGFDAGDNYAVMLQRTDGRQVARLGDGAALAFSPDGKWLLAGVFSAPPKLVLYPTGTGAERSIDVGAFESIATADWFPNGKSILVCGNKSGEAGRCYEHALDGGALRAVTPEGTGSGIVSPDGKGIVAFGQALGHRRYAISGGAGQEIPHLTFNDQVVRWSTDGRALFVSNVSARTLDRLDLTTGVRKPFLDLGPETAIGPMRVGSATLSDDNKVYAYVTSPMSSQLFTVDGLP